MSRFEHMTEIPMIPVGVLELEGVVILVKSHNARRNAGQRCSMKGLLSIKKALYGRQSAATGFYLVSEADAGWLSAQTSRWSRSISFPKQVPVDLRIRTGGIFG